MQTYHLFQSAAQTGSPQQQQLGQMTNGPQQAPISQLAPIHPGQVTQASVASFVVRLMSLSAHELQSLHNDGELMRHLAETQLLMENRLQQTKLTGMIQQQQQQLAFHQHQMQQQQQLVHNNHSPSQQTSYQLASHNLNLQLDQYQHYARAFSVASQQQQQQQYNTTVNGQQQHLLMAAAQAHQQHLHQSQLALDLRTSQQATGLTGLLLPAANQPLYPTASSYYASSPSSAGGSSSAGSSPVEQVAPSQEMQAQQQQPQKRAMNPKKVKLEEYRKQDNGDCESALQTQNRPDNINLISGNQNVLTQISSTNVKVEPVRKRACSSRLTPSAPAAPQSATVLGAIRPSAPTSGGGKKYKGEFDEPTASEVEQRQRDLSRPDTNYHESSAGQCACVLGSVFNEKSNAEMLAVVDRWRRLPTEQRIKSKWDVTDLPKDIPLSEIKKFEDLRRDASNGRADFGGASKRKPLGIRGTRQFLLILYCLWGHPGREDPMQKLGYCPHCFAKIKKANEQSTLVRVVNHFNMKHRRGANPRLSPNRDTLASAAASPQADELQTPLTPTTNSSTYPTAQVTNGAEPNRFISIQTSVPHLADSSSSVSTSTADSPGATLSSPPPPRPTSATSTTSPTSVKVELETSALASGKMAAPSCEAAKGVKSENATDS